MRRGRGSDKQCGEAQEQRGGHALERLHQLEVERGLPETPAEPGGKADRVKPKDRK